MHILQCAELLIKLPRSWRSVTCYIKIQGKFSNFTFGSFIHYTKISAHAHDTILNVVTVDVAAVAFTLYTKLNIYFVIL